MNSDAGSLIRASAATLPNLDHIIRGLLYVYVFSLPFHRLLFVERNGFIILMVLLVLWCAVNRRHFFTQTPIDIPLVAFVAWVALTIPFATFPAYSAKEFAKLLQQGLIFYVVAYFFRDRLCRIRLHAVLMGAICVISVYGLFEFKDLIGARPPDVDLMYVGSFMGAEVWLTTYLVMLLPVVFALALFEQGGWVKTFYAGTTLLSILCLLSTFSRAGALALLCELWVLGWLTRRKVVVMSATLVSLFVIVIGTLLIQHSRTPMIPGTTVPGVKATADSLKYRLAIWTFTTGKIFDHPILGIGYGKNNFPLVYGQSLNDEVQPGHLPVLPAGTHNTFLDIALGTGIPGLLLFVWVIQRISSSALTNFRQTVDQFDKAISLGVAVGIVGLVVRLCFDHMLIGTLAVLFWILVAMAMLAHSTADQTQAQRV